jgi:hypothetical protein
VIPKGNYLSAGETWGNPFSAAFSLGILIKAVVANHNMNFNTRIQRGT